VNDPRMLLAVAGLIVLLAALVALVFIADRRLRDASAEQRRIHLQQATIIGMLIRAGFRGPREGLDWGDSASWTRVRDSSDPRQ
jgi:hypothetical protein